MLATNTHAEVLGEISTRNSLIR